MTAVNLAKSKKKSEKYAFWSPLTNTFWCKPLIQAILLQFSDKDNFYFKHIYNQYETVYDFKKIMIF